MVELAFITDSACVRLHGSDGNEGHNGKKKELGHHEEGRSSEERDRLTRRDPARPTAAIARFTSVRLCNLNGKELMHHCTRR